MKLCFWILLGLSLPAVLSAHSPNVRGVVVNERMEPVGGAVILMSYSGAAVNYRTVSDDAGVFGFYALSGEFRLEVDHGEYEHYTRVFPGSTADIKVVLRQRSVPILPVYIDSKSGYRNPSADITVYDMAGLEANRAVNAAFEVLADIPSLQVEEDKVSVSGSDNLTILIDSKPSTLPDFLIQPLLRTIPVTAVTRVELINNAPAGYHTSGSVLNIVTRRENTPSPHLAGSVNVSLYQLRKSCYFLLTDWHYTSRRFSAGVIYSLSGNDSRTVSDMVSMHTIDGQTARIEKKDTQKLHGQIHFLRFSSGYDFRGSNRLEFVYTGAVFPSFDMSETSSGNYFNSWNNGGGDLNIHNFNLTFNSAKGFRIGADYTANRMPVDRDYIGADQTGNMVFADNRVRQSSEAVKAYADHSCTLGSGWVLNSGAGFTWGSERSLQEIYAGGSGTPFNTTNIRTLRRIYEVYAGIEKRFSGKTFLNFSVSGQHNEVNGYGKWGVYPRLFLSHELEGGNSLQFSMSSSRRYPHYWDMQPDSGYTTDYVTNEGNPELKPYNYYEFRTKYTWLRKYSVQIYFNYAPERIVNIPYQSGERFALIYKSRNADHTGSLGADLTVPFCIYRGMESTLYLDGSYNMIRESETGYDELRSGRFGFRSRLSNSLFLCRKPSVGVELSVWYNSEGLSDIYIVEQGWGIDAGLRMSFAEGRASLSVKAIDIFDTSSKKRRIRYGSQNLSLTRYYESHPVVVTLSYRFGR